MKPNLQEVQHIELEILKKFHDFCESHGLKYVLGYGTLLGAVRHKGFIPWDNDIDVLMPRDDYDKFLKIVTTENIADHLYVQHYTLDPRYHYMCARVCDANTRVNVPYIKEQPTRLGLWIDIFPMDGVGNKSFRLAVQMLMLKWYWLLFRADVYGSTYKNSRTRLNYHIKKVAMHLFRNHDNKHNYSIDRICQWFPFRDSIDVAFLFGEEGVCTMPRSDFDNLIKIQFEDGEFYCSKSYDDFLKQCYGDYMTLPSEEDRITHDIDVEIVSSNEQDGRGDFV